MNIKHNYYILGQFLRFYLESRLSHIRLPFLCMCYICHYNNWISIYVLYVISNKHILNIVRKLSISSSSEPNITQLVETCNRSQIPLIGDITLKLLTCSSTLSYCILIIKLHTQHGTVEYPKSAWVGCISVERVLTRESSNSNTDVP
jgi:hypothetical protein